MWMIFIKLLNTVINFFIKSFHKIVFYLPVDRYKKKYISFIKKALFKNICGNSIFVEYIQMV